MDVKANRGERKWSRAEQIRRLAWALAAPFFKLSPRVAWGWRRFMLRVFGARVGADAHVYPSVRIAIPWTLTLGVECAIGDRAILYSLGEIQIGDRATISQGAHLCAGTHDWRRPAMPLVKASIDVQADAWICADAFVGPGVVVGAGAILGARAVALRNIPANAIAIGNPATIVSDRTKSRPSDA